jgi:hypothetical protein
MGGNKTCLESYVAINRSFVGINEILPGVTDEK